ncbi:hypothetical protein HEP87_52270 [Streptomyces sp. S1D4-11]|nr:hypothetical protein [Streptomyces sp. S1D4-11]QIZ00748.1 hypothetical protein HEP87_52270 [Streptomyces sp. S1D4-11]
MTRPGERHRPELIRTVEALQTLAARWEAAVDAERISTDSDATPASAQDA